MAEQLTRKLQEAFEAHRSGRRDEARRVYQDVLSDHPHDPDANNLMGLLCIEEKKPVRALRYIRRALAVDSGNAQSHYNLGIAMRDLDRMAEAAEAFAAAVTLDPENIEFRSSLGNALRLSGNYPESVRVLETAYRKASGNKNLRRNLALAQNDLGASLIRDGDPAQAMRHFERAIELEPLHAEAHINIGLTLEQLGDFENAARHYAAAIRARPDFADAHFQLAHLRTHRSTPAEIEAMTRLVDSPRTRHADRARLAHGLGFALESAENYAKAFSYMSLAHEIERKRSPFDLEAAATAFKAIRRVFDRDRLAEAGQRSGDDRPVLIAGMPRSGTTLTEQILASHPEVLGMGEMMALSKIARSLASPRPFPEGLETLGKEQILGASDAYLESLTRDAQGQTRITDTTPMNFLLIGLAAILLPSARFVICMRDPMDNCLSIFRQMLTGANEFAHRLEDLGAYYRLHFDLVRHWKELLDKRVFCLQYEHLVEDSEAQIRRLLDFCDLPFDSRCLAFHESRRRVRSPSAAHVRQPIYADSIGAWRRYEKELAPLRAALGDLTESCGHPR
jgi:Flp pilus assembly protein TadD